MVGRLGKIISPFQLTSGLRVGDCTTTIRRRDVGARRRDRWVFAEFLRALISLKESEALRICQEEHAELKCSNVPMKSIKNALSGRQSALATSKPFSQSITDVRINIFL